MSEPEYPPSSPTPSSAAIVPPLAIPLTPARLTGSPAVAEDSPADRRIATLELALDEALTVLQELRSQLKDQQMLEGQLARLEDFSNMQHQAIGELKQQLTQILTLGLSSEGLLRQAQVSTLEVDCPVAHPRPSEGALPRSTATPAVTAAWEAAESATTIATLQQALATAHQQIHALETEIARQTIVQATLQQACQELEQERDQQAKRLQSLEQQHAEMQEQILKQVRQAQEHEAAIQHWQTRCLAGQQQAMAIESLLQRLASQLTTGPPAPATLTTTFTEVQTALAELLALLAPSTMASREDFEARRMGPPPANPKPLQVDLPSFLSRRPS
ncbi:hypothetical protein [Trichothermofontia sp.]